MSLDNLERIDASREWLGVILRIPCFRTCSTPRQGCQTPRLGSRCCARRKPCVLKVGIVSLRVHVGSSGRTASLLASPAACLSTWPQTPEQLLASLPVGHEQRAEAVPVALSPLGRRSRHRAKRPGGPQYPRHLPRFFAAGQSECPASVPTSGGGAGAAGVGCCALALSVSPTRRQRQYYRSQLRIIEIISLVY